MPNATGPMATPTCGHPDRDVKARGLCKPCWSREQRVGWASAANALKIADLGPGTTVRFGRQTKLVHEVVGTVAGLAKLYDQAVVDVADVRLYAAPGPATCPECIAQKADPIYDVVAGRTKAAKAPSKAEMKRRQKLADEALATLPTDDAGVPQVVTLHDISGQQYPDDPDQTAGPAPAGTVECPECGKAVSKSNKARHLKSHAA